MEATMETMQSALLFFGAALFVMSPFLYAMLRIELEHRREQRQQIKDKS